MAAQKVSTVSFMSYNLFCLPGLATAFSPTSCPKSSERSNAFLEHTLNYDVICLQEIWNPCYKNVERFARKNNLHVVGSATPSTAHFVNLRVFGGGLMIVSKHPIVDTQQIVFDKGSQADRFVTKGVLYAKVKIGSSYVHVFNTHMQASYGYEFDWSGSNPYTAIRQKQLKRLASFVETVTCKDKFPVLLMGDFNVNARVSPDDGADSNEYIEMMQILQSPSYKVVDILKEHHGGEHPVTYGGNGVLHGEEIKVGGQRLDFILEFKKDTSAHHLDYEFIESQIVPFKVTDENFTHISDHYAQLVKMQIKSSDEDGADTDGSLSHASISFH